MGIKRVELWPVAMATGAFASATAYAFFSTVATWSLRYGACGQSTLDAPDAFCRSAAELDIAWQILFSLTVLAARVWIALWRGVILFQREGDHWKPMGNS
ncbi:MAG: hypothetical protein ACXIUZ_05590 [Lysobacteraceae bacterium]